MKWFKEVIVLSLTAAVVFAALPVAKTLAADSAPVDVMLSGEPVDMNCYLQDKSGEGHAACATACATKGNPIGLVVQEDGKQVLYLVLGGGGKASKDLLAAHMGTVVDVTGKASVKDGMKIIVASAVTVEEEEWFPEESVGSASIVN